MGLNSSSAHGVMGVVGSLELTEEVLAGAAARVSQTPERSGTEAAACAPALGGVPLAARTAAGNAATRGSRTAIVGP